MNNLPSTDNNFENLRKYAPAVQKGEIPQGEGSDNEDQIEGSPQVKGPSKNPRIPFFNQPKKCGEKPKKCNEKVKIGKINNVSNNEKINILLNRNDINDEWDDLAQSVLFEKLADPHFDYPQSKSIQQEDGLLITVQKSRRYDINCGLWEAIHSLNERTVALTHLRRKAWKIPPHLDAYNPSSSNSVVAAPVGYNCFFFVGILRLLCKMYDDAPNSLSAKLVSSVGILKVLEWYFTKLALGRDDRIVKRYLLESIGTDGNILSVLERLETLELNRTWLGKKGFDEYRDDIQPTRLDFYNSEGACAPTLNIGARKLREKQVCLLMLHYSRPIDK